MYCSRPCALPSRLHSALHCTKKKTGPLHKSLGKQSFTAGYFNTYGEKKGHREKSGEVDSGEEKRLLKAHHGDQG